MEQAVLDAELAETQPFVEKAASRLMELKASLRRMATQDLHRIHAATGFEDKIKVNTYIPTTLSKIGTPSFAIILMFLCFALATVNIVSKSLFSFAVS